MSHVLWAFAAIALSHIGMKPVLGNQAQSTDNIVFSACEIESPTTHVAVAAECANTVLPLDPADPDGDVIELSLARLSAYSNQTSADALAFIAGGPGQSAIESYPGVQTAFDKIREHRDIYLIDQRGTGKSSPLLCPEAVSSGAVLEFDAAAVKASASECRESLSLDPEFFTTSIAVQDLDSIRQRLGIDQWNLYGVSYGTRVALHYLRRFPDQVRTLILDAVVPPDVALGATLALDAERAFDLMLKRCKADTACDARFPALGEKTRELIASLRESPVSVTFENFQTGRLDSIEFTANHLTLTMRMMTYVSYGTSLLPTMLHDAYANQNFAPLARQARQQSRSLESTIATGMHHAVVCTEDQPWINFSEQEINTLAATYLGRDPINALMAMCHSWSPGVIDADFKEPVQSDKPVLLLSGEADPITPPAFAEQVAAHLPNSLHIVNPGQGHAQAWLGCTPSIMARFVTTANVDDVDFGCLERQQPPPFFIDANGPTP
ncbi:MAG: alpha/beta hydrolase [Granulosicoccus sp.]|nr:alpha/beta hydrolase [Granulosicoccus sp.]